MTALTDQLVRTTAGPRARHVTHNACTQIQRARACTQSFRPVALGAPALEAQSFGPMPAASIHPCTPPNGSGAPDTPPCCMSVHLQLLQLRAVPGRRIQRQKVAGVNSALVCGSFVTEGLPTGCTARDAVLARPSTAALPAKLLLPSSREQHLPVNAGQLSFLLWSPKRRR